MDIGTLVVVEINYYILSRIGLLYDFVYISCSFTLTFNFILCIFISLLGVPKVHILWLMVPQVR